MGLYLQPFYRLSPPLFLPTKRAPHLRLANGAWGIKDWYIFFFLKKRVWQDKGFPLPCPSMWRSNCRLNNAKVGHNSFRMVRFHFTHILSFSSIAPIFSMVWWDFARLPRVIKTLYWLMMMIVLDFSCNFFLLWRFLIYDCWLICWVDSVLSEDLDQSFQVSKRCSHCCHQPLRKGKKNKKEVVTWRDGLEGTRVVDSTHGWACSGTI